MKILAVDPGEDTGYSVWDGEHFIDGGTEKLWTFADLVWYGQEDKQSLFYKIEVIVCEDFRIYPWAAKDLAWDQVRTARLIGALTFMARVKGWEFVLQPAKIKERAEALGAEEFFRSPLHENRHFNDSCRHSWYYQKSCEHANVKLVNVPIKAEEDSAKPTILDI